MKVSKQQNVFLQQCLHKMNIPSGAEQICSQANPKFNKS